MNKQNNNKAGAHQTKKRRMQGNPIMYHGTLYKKDWPAPVCVAYSEEGIRPDQKNNITASEYMDEPEVLSAKMKIVADLLKKSKNAIVYTGAGISSSRVNCYATRAKGSVVKKVKKGGYTEADPAYAHEVIANLGNQGLIQKHVNQNHDSFTQLAGLPEDKICEIHGSWTSIDNPVIQFSGNLRSDLFRDLLKWEEKADFCLCMGTSLSGMNADRVVSTPMEKFAGKEDGAKGSVIINLQKTPLDVAGYAPIRVWGRIDDAMKLLVKHLGIKMNKYKLPEPKENKVIVPYDKRGKYDPSKKMVLDFSPGSKIKVTHPQAGNKGKEGMVVCRDKKGFKIDFGDRYAHHHGAWWLDMYSKGQRKYLGVMNVNPKFIK